MGLGWLHHAGPGALPDHGAHGGLGVQLVDAVRAARPAAQALRGDLQSAALVARRRHANAARRTNAPDHHQPACQAGGHTSRADQLSGLPEYTESDCGAVDRRSSGYEPSSPARSPNLCSQQRALRPCRPQKLRRPDTLTAVLRINRRDDKRRPSASVVRDVSLPGYSSFLCLILRRSPCGAGTGYAFVCLENLNARLLTLLEAEL